MKRLLYPFVVFLFATCATKAQNISGAANYFISTLDSAKKMRTVYPFDIDERYKFNYVPLDNRKGISVNELTPVQKQAAFALLKSCLSTNAANKVKSIMMLDAVLKVLEQRKPDDHFRDTGKYFFTIFGLPAENNIWGWRLEGHHLGFNFYADKNKLVAGTPGFLGSNPAIVQDGPSKGQQVLKEETEMGFALLHSLNTTQLKTAIIDTAAPAEIITSNKRTAMLLNPAGICYTALNPKQKELFLQLVRLYINRYTRLFAAKMLKETEAAGLDKLYFGWAGVTDMPGPGHPHYYRIQTSNLLIEYDNTQNNANHVHTVVRDLKHDFGGDLLLQHYQQAH